MYHTVIVRNVKYLSIIQTELLQWNRSLNSALITVVFNVRGFLKNDLHSLLVWRVARNSWSIFFRLVRVHCVKFRVQLVTSDLAKLSI